MRLRKKRTRDGCPQIWALVSGEVDIERLTEAALAKKLVQGLQRGRYRIPAVPIRALTRKCLRSNRPMLLANARPMIVILGAISRPSLASWRRAAESRGPSTKGKGTASFTPDSDSQVPTKQNDGRRRTPGNGPRSQWRRATGRGQLPRRACDLRSDRPVAPRCTRPCLFRYE